MGSTSYVTDKDGSIYQHVQYFPFGETWVEETSSTEKLPYLFTSKELDEETGLYYFGARYYDPRTSVWQSTDPALGSPSNSVGSSLELASHAYGGQNPIKFNDPTGTTIQLLNGLRHRNGSEFLVVFRNSRGTSLPYASSKQVVLK